MKELLEKMHQKAGDENKILFVVAECDESTGCAICGTSEDVARKLITAMMHKEAFAAVICSVARVYTKHITECPGKPTENDGDQNDHAAI